uniref:Uncharacterized protein n=1 Tax=Aegilops tauschii subsp. strangulata TaxID=200361 RepID=A0A453EBL2_AEGTS
TSRYARAPLASPPLFLAGVRRPCVRDRPINKPALPQPQVLQVLPLPLPYTITAFQLAFGSLVIFFMWAAKLHPVPKLSAAQVRQPPEQQFFRLLFSEFALRKLKPLLPFSWPRSRRWPPGTCWARCSPT